MKEIHIYKDVEFKYVPTNDNPADIATRGKWPDDLVNSRLLNWIGHLLRRDGENDCRTAVGWTPEGRRCCDRRERKVFWVIK